ncbi:MAG TPA: N-acetylmuramoyl-L-alanine amidase [Candidatus Paceibacterota bacterium]|nr:N-acetylmuramoyl-L-alanine amidase [Candidatus Paceibacterota bacterium]
MITNRAFSIANIVLLTSLLLLSLYPAFANAEASPLVGKVIALDSGHGESETSFGTSGLCDIASTTVTEVEVNNAVRQVLSDMITDAGGEVFPVPQLESRNARVDAAEVANSDVLISIHHNGSTNISTDYTQFFVTQKNDKELANAIYPFMLSAVQGVGKGIKSDGYGMTVYGSLPGVLTESYFITNTDRACEFVAYLADTTNTNSIVHREAQALFDGLESYFTQSGGSEGGGGKGRNR